LHSTLAARRARGLRILLFVLECALGIIAVGLAAAFTQWSRWLLPVAVLLYLLIVVATALLSGFWQAVIVSLSAVGVQAFLSARQPQSNLAVYPVNTVTLVVFVLVALTVSRLSARVTNNAREAESRGGQMHDLYEFTRRTLQMNLHVEPGPQLADLVHDIFALEAVAVFDADLHTVYQAGFWNADPEEMARNVYYFETSDDDPQSGLGRRVVRLGTVPVGSLVVRGETTPLVNNAIASLIAITFELTNRLLTTARLDAGEVALRASPVGVASMVEEVVASLGDRLASMKVIIKLEEDDMVVACDRQLMVMLLTQYVDNACKYSIFGTAITIRVVRSRAEVIFSVHSFGPVIPMADRERIFNRYYRSSTQSNRAPGTGIGLSVAKRVAVIHGGYVWVTSEEVEGTTFFAAIPAPIEKRKSL